jgi:hypothetical protein
MPHGGLILARLQGGLHRKLTHGFNDFNESVWGGGAPHKLEQQRSGRPTRHARIDEPRTVDCKYDAAQLRAFWSISQPTPRRTGRLEDARLVSIHRLDMLAVPATRWFVGWLVSRLLVLQKPSDMRTQSISPPPPPPLTPAPSGELTEHQLADDHGAIDGLLPETLEQREFAQRSGQR